MTRLATLAASIAILHIAEAPVASAKPEFAARIPNGANVPDAPAIGHSDSTGSSSSLNAFGKAFEKAGNKWTQALCQADSDGDGQTNGQELGDPCCEWTTSNKTVRWTTGVSHPGVKSKTTSAALLASANCTGSSSSSASSTSATTPSATTSDASVSNSLALAAALTCAATAVAAL